MPIQRIKVSQVKKAMVDAAQAIRDLPREMLLAQAENKYKLAQLEWTAKGSPVTEAELERDMRSDWKLTGWVYQKAGISFDQLFELAKKAIADPSGAAPVDPGAAKIADSSIVRKVVAPAMLHIGRNKPCPCGSGLKYKRCCGK